MSPTFVLMTVAEPSLRNQAPKLGSVYPILTVLFAVEPNWAVPATSNLTAGLVVPMPTLPPLGLNMRLEPRVSVTGNSRIGAVGTVVGDEPEDSCSRTEGGS